ncbi:succinate dehydrogenase, cytochrome b556 subunit [Marinibaculum pumilum]|uniref:Succinate dehydrogenase cytochrome b556 subunit n=1 Tax=Marinibaculum pumilum TaxID=1766165 RepID=A0ABV7L1N3_9PROT
MAQVERPISPHLQIYKPQITSVMSALHRLTGIALGVGTLLLTWWLIALAAGPDSFEVVQDFIGSVLGIIILIGFSWALFYHLCNGIRHLFWDMGRGFELSQVTTSGWTVVIGSVVLTVLAWILALSW